MGGHRRRRKPLKNPWTRLGDRITSPSARRTWDVVDWAWALQYGGYHWGLLASRELRRQIEQHEYRHVEAAWRAGLDWYQIGQRLGVSRQWAHRKWAARMRDPAWPPEPDPPHDAC